MTRDELIEKMARAHYAKYFEVVADMEPAFHEQPESHQDRMREAMEAALTAIEASGLCIVPREEIPRKKALENVRMLLRMRCLTRGLSRMEFPENQRLIVRKLFTAPLLMLANSKATAAGEAKPE